VLVGEYRGQAATLLEKHREEEQAVIQLKDDLEVVIVSMNHIAALA
jgi:hypothetical protein